MDNIRDYPNKVKGLGLKSAFRPGSLHVCSGRSSIRTREKVEPSRLDYSRWGPPELSETHICKQSPLKSLKSLKCNKEPIRNMSRRLT